MAACASTFAIRAGRRRGHGATLPWILTLLAVGGALAVTVILTGTRLLVPSEQAVIPSSNWAWTHDGVVVEPVGPSGGPSSAATSSWR